MNKCRDASNSAPGAENQSISCLYRVFIVVCVRRSSTFITNKRQTSRVPASDG